MRSRSRAVETSFQLNPLLNLASCIPLRRYLVRELFFSSPILAISRSLPLSQSFILFDVPGGKQPKFQLPMDIIQCHLGEICADSSERIYR
jgi:hypothetical protein